MKINLGFIVCIGFLIGLFSMMLSIPLVVVGLHTVALFLYCTGLGTFALIILGIICNSLFKLTIKVK